MRGGGGGGGGGGGLMFQSTFVLAKRDILTR